MLQDETMKKIPSFILGLRLVKVEVLQLVDFVMDQRSVELREGKSVAN